MDALKSFRRDEAFGVDGRGPAEADIRCALCCCVHPAVLQDETLGVRMRGIHMNQIVGMIGALGVDEAMHTWQAWTKSGMTPICRFRRKPPVLWNHEYRFICLAE